MYRQHDWHVIIQLQACNGPRKGRITGRITRPSHHNLSLRLCPRASSAVFFYVLPSTSMSSINHYQNGTPIKTRGQALEAQRLRESSRSGRDNSRKYIGFARTKCRDAQGIFWGARYNLLKDIKVPGQTRLERREMAAKLKRHGLLDRSEYAMIKMFMK